MGYPGKNRKTYETPNHPYQGGRIQEEHNLVEEYGLKSKRELWNAQSDLRRYRREARRLLGEAESEQTRKEREQLQGHLRRLGILKEDSTLDDILTLDITDILERRLQTVVYRKGLANTPDQSRQFISHGHITIGQRRVRVPSYMVETKEEDDIGFYHNSPLSDDLHPERAKATQE